MSVTLPDTAASTTPPPADGLAALPDDVRAFCEKYHLTAHLPMTFRLLREEFEPVGEIEMRIMDDPEEDFTRLILTIPFGGDVRGVLDSFHRYLERWIPVTPPDARMRLVVNWNFHS